MNARPDARLALVSLAVTLVLAACGNKGPLVLPDKPKPQTSPATTTPKTETPPENAPVDPDAPPAAPLPLDNEN